MTPHNTDKLDDAPPSHLVRNVCAWTAVAALLVAGHLTWKNLQPRHDDNRLATSPASTDKDQAAANTAAGRLKTSQTLRR